MTYDMDTIRKLFEALGEQVEWAGVSDGARCCLQWRDDAPPLITTGWYAAMWSDRAERVGDTNEGLLRVALERKTDHEAACLVVEAARRKLAERPLFLFPSGMPEQKYLVGRRKPCGRHEVAVGQPWEYMSDDGGWDNGPVVVLPYESALLAGLEAMDRQASEESK